MNYWKTVQWDVVWSTLRTLCVAGGPLTAALIALGFPPVQVSTWMGIALLVIGVLSVIVPGLIGAFSQTDSHAVAKVAAMPAPVAQEALKAIPDDAKLKVVEAVPDVATIVLKDNVNGEMAKLAASDAHPNIVTETQNEADAKKGTKV